MISLNEPERMLRIYMTYSILEFFVSEMDNTNAICVSMATLEKLFKKSRQSISKHIKILDAKLSKLFYQTVFYLTDDDKINYFRYQAIAYLDEDLRDTYYDQAVLVSGALAGIMKTLMIKRLESSFYSFRITLNNLLVSSERMIQMFENDKVLIAPDLNINQLIEKGFSMEEIEDLIVELSIENPKNNIFTADDFEEEFLIGLKKDRGLLQELLNDWNKVKGDPKLDKLIEALDNELFNKEIKPLLGNIINAEEVSTKAEIIESLDAFKKW